MKLIRSIAKLLAHGVAVNMRVSGTPDKVQIDLLGSAPKENKANIHLPALTFMGTPEEVDDQLEEYLEKYCDSAVRITQTAADADEQLRKAEEEAKAAAKAALDAKKAKAPSKPTGLKKPATPSAGLAGDDDDNDEGDEDGEGEAKTTLDTAAGSGSGTALKDDNQGGPAKTRPSSDAHPALALDLF